MPTTMLVFGKCIAKPTRLICREQPDPVVPPKERPPLEPPPSSFMDAVEQIRKCVQHYLEIDRNYTIIVIVAEDRMRTSESFIDQCRDSDKDKLGMNGIYNEYMKSNFRRDNGYRQVPSILWLDIGSRLDCGDRQVPTREPIRAASIHNNNTLTMPTDVFTHWRSRADENSIKNCHDYHQVTSIAYGFDNPGIDRCFRSNKNIFRIVNRRNAWNSLRLV